MSDSLTLHWDVDGDFITNMARDWFYKERQPYSKVYELLLNCMQGSDETIEQLNRHVDDILTFKSKLSGSILKGTYGLYDEDNMDTLKTKYPAYKYYSYLKDGKEIPFSESEYGFISPQGYFIPVDWCHHSEWAHKYVKSYNLYEDMMKSDFRDPTDYLVYQKGYILLENPQRGRAMIQRPTNISNKQRETLYDYYMFHGRQNEAFKLYQELDD